MYCRLNLAPHACLNICSRLLCSHLDGDTFFFFFLNEGRVDRFFVIEKKYIYITALVWPGCYTISIVTRLRALALQVLYILHMFLNQLT